MNAGEVWPGKSAFPSLIYIPMKKIDSKRLIKTFLELLKIDGPTFKERAVADYLLQQFSRLGISGDEDGAGSVIGGDCGNLLFRMPGRRASRPELVFCSHLDTIVSTRGVKVVEKDGVFSSSGDSIIGADDRGGVATMLELARALVESGGSPVPVRFLFTVAEETGLLGVKQLRPEWAAGGIAFVLDSSGPVGSVVNRAPFAVKIRAVIKGRAAHSGIEPEAGVNAVVISSRAIAGMRLGRVDFETTANIGIIKGGEAINIVPDRVELLGEARSLDRDKMKKQVLKMERVLRDSAAEEGGEVEFSFQSDYPGFAIPETSKEIALVREAAEKLSLPFLLAASGGGSDANILNSLGLTALNLSTGMARPHSPGEHIARDDLIRLGNLLLAIVERAAGSMQRHRAGEMALTKDRAEKISVMRSKKIVKGKNILSRPRRNAKKSEQVWK